jgi:hypothetical protein
VPDRFIAAPGGMKPRALMEANDFERAPVEVKFAEPDTTALPIMEGRPPACPNRFTTHSSWPVDG